MKWDLEGGLLLFGTLVGCFSQYWSGFLLYLYTNSCIHSSIAKTSEAEEYLKPVTHRNSNLFSSTAISTAFIIMNIPAPG